MVGAALRLGEGASTAADAGAAASKLFVHWMDRHSNASTRLAAKLPSSE